jgi:hypothetical protein
MQDWGSQSKLGLVATGIGGGVSVFFFVPDNSGFFGAGGGGGFFLPSTDGTCPTELCRMPSTAIPLLLV